MMPVTSPLWAKPLTSLRMAFSYAFLPLPMRTENVTLRQLRPGDVEASETICGFSMVMLVAALLQVNSIGLQ